MKPTINESEPEKKEGLLPTLAFSRAEASGN